MIIKMKTQTEIIYGVSHNSNVCVIELDEQVLLLTLTFSERSLPQNLTENKRDTGH